MTDSRLLRFALVSALLFASSGCALTVKSLGTEMIRIDRPSAPFPVSLRVDRLNDEGLGSNHLIPDQSGLAQALRATRFFSEVTSANSESAETDWVLRGSIETEWSSQGADNFFTYFPGGLVFAPSWHGTRWKYRTTATMELVERQSGRVLGNYAISTQHELIHRSGNPMHFFGAAIVIPGVVRGSVKASSRDNYEQHLYDVAHPELWERIATQIAADMEPSFRAELAELRRSCGDHYDAPPKVGDSFEEFRRCQPNHFRHKGERQIHAGTATIYEDTTERWTIYVVDDQIEQWDGDSVLPAVSDAPPSR